MVGKAVATAGSLPISPRPWAQAWARTRTRKQTRTRTPGLRSRHRIHRILALSGREFDRSVAATDRSSIWTRTASSLIVGTVIRPTINAAMFRSYIDVGGKPLKRKRLSEMKARCRPVMNFRLLLVSGSLRLLARHGGDSGDDRRKPEPWTRRDT